MTLEEANAIIKITDSLKEGIMTNHDYSKNICKQMTELARLVGDLEQRVKKLRLKFFIIIILRMINKFLITEKRRGGTIRCSSFFILFVPYRF